MLIVFLEILFKQKKELIKPNPHKPANEQLKNILKITTWSESEITIHEYFHLRLPAMFKLLWVTEC